ncbi:MAG: glutathione S-transferase N-terminal domain-containing protein, partial [Planctomycetota bacterium]
MRDRNGWCPYSARVWLALHAKGLVEGLDYAVAVVDNQGDKPPWWYERGGSTTPAVLW